MKVLINQVVHDLPEGACLAQAINVIDAKQPFAAAVNTHFVPRAQYHQHLLHDGDHIEIISPVTGG